MKDAQEKMKKIQENMKKKYSCDRSTTATRLEDLLQDAVVSRSPCLGMCRVTNKTTYTFHEGGKFF